MPSSLKKFEAISRAVAKAYSAAPPPLTVPETPALHPSRAGTFILTCQPKSVSFSMTDISRKPRN